MVLSHYFSRIDNTKVWFQSEATDARTLDAAVCNGNGVLSWPKVSSIYCLGAHLTVDTTSPDETASTMKKPLDRMDRWETKLPATRKEKQEFMVLRV